MWPKILSLAFAAAALTGAVIYSQSKAEKKPKKIEVFESSKSGTPTPWPEGKESPTEIKKKPVKKAEEEKPVKQEKAQPEKKPAAVMPSSKSMIPEPPVKKPPPPPT